MTDEEREQVINLARFYRHWDSENLVYDSTWSGDEIINDGWVEYFLEMVRIVNLEPLSKSIN